MAQFAGAHRGAALLKLMTSGFGGVTDETGDLGTNNWGPTISAGGAFVLEVVLTFVFVARHPAGDGPVGHTGFRRPGHRARR